MLRTFLAIVTILSACGIQVISEYSVETPISEELARLNPVAILFMAALILLLIHLIFERLQSGDWIQGWSLFPLVPCLAAIAFTSPPASVHLNLFAGVATYGFVWLTLFSFLHGRRMIALFTGLLALFSLVFLGMFSLVDLLSPGTNLSPPPLGLFQKALILLFAVFAIDNRPSK